MNDPAVQPPTRGKAIMIVEDDDDIREAVALLLEGHQYVVDARESALHALEGLRAGALPDVILLDLNMPGMDGWEFRVQQKRQPSWAGIPVVAFSADSSAKAAAIDAHAYLTKPVDPRILIQTLERLLSALEREQLHAREKELERLSSLGVLAAGIAHEVNDPLSFVLGNLQLAERKMLELEQRLSSADAFSLVGIRQVIARAKRGGERIAAVVGSVSTFARADTGELVAVDVRELMESTLQLASNEIRHAARLERKFEPVPAILSNPSKLGRVFLNLILNAVHAIDASDPGDHLLRVSIRVGDNRDVVIAVSDTGPGIPPELMPRIFDPFFALRPVGASMGLGLSVTRELVTELNGTIEVASTLHKGTTFSVILPSRGLPPLDKRASGPPRGPRKRPRVLVIDDEPLLCALLEEMLAIHYDVVVAASPIAGLEQLQREHFDVILCDLMMPELTGMDLYERVAAEGTGKDERFIFVTGGAFSERARSFLATTRRPQVKKPFRQEDVVDAIESILARVPE